jgi:hypothetical protein
LTAFATVLHRWSGQTDLVIGSPVAGRDSIEIEDLIGFFVNTLPLRIDASGDPRFSDLLQCVRRLCIEAQDRRAVPFDRIVEALGSEYGKQQQPLFSVMFTFLTEPTRRYIEMESLSWRQIDIDRGFANRDLTLRIEPNTDELQGWFEFDTDLFERTTIEHLTTQFLTLLEAACRDSSTRIGVLDIRTGQEQAAETNIRTQAAAARRERFVRTIRRPLSPQRQMSPYPLIGDRKSPMLFDMRADEIDPLGWVQAHQDDVERAFADTGAVLLRGFIVSEPAELEQICQVFVPELMAYSEASTPRTSLGGGVYTSTEYPADQYIAPHNEMAYASHWPRRIWFYCAHPPQLGGATPMVDCEALYEAMDPALRERFEHEGVLYVRNFGHGVDLSWQSVFGTDNPSTVEAICRANGIRIEWRTAGRLRTSQKGQAVLSHLNGKQKLWFNSAHMFHVSALPPSVRAALETTLGPDELPRNAFYGDGSPIDAEVIARIRASYRDLSLRFEWRRGDLLMLDNMRWAHGRDAFQGERKVWVTMA